MNNWEDLMNGWIKDTEVSPRQAKRAIQTFLTYLGKDVGVLEIKRETHINDVKGHSYTFRKYLIENFKSGSSKNVILSHLEKFFDYVGLQCNAVGKDYSNPICYKFDKFKIFKKSGTVRQALPLNINAAAI